MLARLKADFHLTFFVPAGLTPKSEHVKWSRFGVSCESQKVDRVSTFWRSQRTRHRAAIGLAGAIAPPPPLFCNKRLEHFSEGLL